jgi:LmbE family N-acetylglucosaminyl deacetylase
MPVASAIGSHNDSYVSAGLQKNGCKKTMRLDFTDERVLAVVAHPDDADYLCAGTLARAKADGAAIGICVLCQGDRGQPTPPLENLADLRREEMAAAAGVLGAVLLRGEFSDGHLADIPEHRERLVELFRQFRPTLILTHSADDYHSDHRVAGALAEAASWYCTSAGHPGPSPVMAVQPALWWMDTMNMTRFEPGFYVDISQYVDVKRRMLDCHTSQLQRAGDRSFSPLETQMLWQSESRGAQAGVEAAEAFRLHLAWKRIPAW